MNSDKLSMLSTTRSGHNFIKGVIESWLPGVKITVMENALPEHVYQYKLDAHSLRVIVIRDFRDFLASSLKSKLDFCGLSGPWRESIELKIKVYRAILVESIEPEFYDADVVIRYEQFCIDRFYRQLICDQLRGTYTEDMLGHVSDEGNGSSFDKLEYQGKGQEMTTRARHVQILETEWADQYREYLALNDDLV